MTNPISNFQLSESYLSLLDDLSAGLRGHRYDGLRDAIAYWHAVVAEAGRSNADDLAADDWGRLAQLNDPSTITLMDDGIVVRDWAQHLAIELVTQWEGRAILPIHHADRKTCHDLAQRIRNWGTVRGYALYLCLRYFWCHPDAGVNGGEWWHPEVWLTPTARAKEG